MKYISLLLAIAFSGFLILPDWASFYQKQQVAAPAQTILVNASTAKAPATVANVVALAQAFKATLTSSQTATLQQTYSSTLAHKWSNLPCGSGCRNGIQFSTLTSAQLTAALAVIQAAAGLTTNEGSSEFSQIRAADDVLKATAGGNTYSSGIYFISFLNEPTTTGTWMLQYGGHHYAANIAMNNGVVVGATPLFEGVEPTSFTVSGTTYAPMLEEKTAMTTMLASLSATQLATAKLSTTFSDVLLGPNQDGNFPATKVGISVASLSTAQQTLVLNAMKPWVQDVDDVTAATLLAVYQNELANTYIAYTGTGTSGNASSFLVSNTNYVRIDGPSVWIEMVAQSGVVFPNQIHYHTIWRDHKRDYGSDLTLTALPVTLLNFTASAQNENNLVNWTTTVESKASHFEVQKTTDLINGVFSTFASVAATNTTETHQYSVVDNAVGNVPMVYYRLKMIDLDGTTTYSRIVGLKHPLLISSVYPNPVTDQLNLTVTNELTNGSLFIVNSAGKTVLIQRTISGKDVKVNVSGLASGAYVVKLEDASGSYTAKFIK